MTELKSIPDQIEILRSQINDDPSSAIDRLIDFVREFAITPDLYMEALLSKMPVRRAGSEGAREKQREKMLALLDAVIQDRESAGPEAWALRAGHDLVRTRYAGRDLDPRVVVECHGLGKSFRDFHLADINLALRLGRITGLLGENATGKTTLFRLLVGEIRQSEGSLSYPEFGSPDPAHIDWGSVRRSIAYVPQHLPSWHGSLEDNLRFAAASHGILGTENDREFLYITERLGLRDFLDRTWRELSGGYQLRFELARALIWGPKLLALDEPLANLDFKGQLTLLRDIRNLARSFTAPIAVIISSQHLHEVEAVADDILFLNNGKVTFYGPLKDVGQNRQFNTYEINCDAALSAVTAAIQGPQVLKVFFNGLSIVIETTRELDRDSMLRKLIDADLGLTYFRDLSKSVKQLFG